MVRNEKLTVLVTKILRGPPVTVMLVFVAYDPRYVGHSYPFLVNSTTGLARCRRFLEACLILVSN